MNDNVKLPERRTCTRCGFVASQEICKACVLLEGLNTGNPKLGIGKSNKAKRALGLMINDGSENKTKTRDEKGVSKKKLRREMKRQKQQTFCGGQGDGNCESGCGKQITQDSNEYSSLNFKSVCGPDHKKIVISNLPEWLEALYFDNIVAFEDVSDEEECVCDHNCQTTLLSDEKMPEVDIKENEQKNTSHGILKSPESFNIPGVLVDDEIESYYFNISVFKSLMIEKHPEILDELKALDKEGIESLGDTVTEPSMSSKTKINFVPTESKDKDKDLSKLTLNIEKSLILGSSEKQLDSTINKAESAESPSQNCDVKQSEDPVVIKANPLKKASFLITPEMMHKASNNLDF